MVFKLGSCSYVKCDRYLQARLMQVVSFKTLDRTRSGRKVCSILSRLRVLRDDDD